MPTIVEYMDDRKGDENKRQDVYSRAAYMALVSLPVGAYFAVQGLPFWLGYLKGFAAAFGLFNMFFDYFIAAVFNHKWFQYLGKLGKFDNLPIWRKAGKYGRFAVKLAIFAASMYFLLT